MTPETRYAKSGSVNIAYHAVGEGPVDLVFVPGWVSHIEHAWEALAPLGLVIRAGLHTGECEVRGDLVSGIAVHTGARVAAGVDEVWVSSTVKELVAGSGLRFEPRGAHSLKGIPGEWQLCAAQV